MIRVWQLQSSAAAAVAIAVATSVLSAYEVLTTMHYINRRFTYLLTYFLAAATTDRAVASRQLVGDNTTESSDLGMHNTSLLM